MLKYKLGKYLKNKVKSYDKMSAFEKPVEELQKETEKLMSEVDLILKGLYKQFAFTDINVSHTWDDGVATIEIDAVGGLGDHLYSIDDGVTYHESNIFDVTTAGGYPVRVKDMLNMTIGTLYQVTPEP